MARKLVENTEAREATPKVPKRAAKTSNPVRWRLILGSVGFVLVVGLSLYAFQIVEAFLIRDPRFALAGPDGPADQVLRITGASHASARRIEAVFAQDAGRSLYMVPLDERLAAVREVDWVRDASVARVWPNRLMVQVEERKPVAFVTLPPSKFALIDAEGVILPPTKDRFSLPVLIGVKSSDALEKRQQAVQHMLRVTAELGDEAKDVSEIDVTDADNLAISREHSGHVVRLLLGDRNYAQRYATFLRHRDDVDANSPGARVLDLRLEDRITVVEDAK